MKYYLLYLEDEPWEIMAFHPSYTKYEIQDNIKSYVRDFREWQFDGYYNGYALDEYVVMKLENQYGCTKIDWANVDNLYIGS